ncbi:MAG: S-layer homology domain-containing protein [Negativicutes bacterium]|nr:S-layer homology domain-containing protein [Negativicutes bacterium]
MKKCLLKKSISLTLGLAFGLSLSATAFAAQNPFVDVPANHWSYAAVNQLAKDGIVDGYGDKTFRGDKTISRYEMAQIVAKAVDREDKADAADRAMIDKLAKEYSSEIKGLDSRVTKLEKNNIKFSGDVRLREMTNWDLRSPVYDGNVQKVQERFRLGVAADLSKDVSFNGRLSAQSYDREDMPPGSGVVTGTFGMEVAEMNFKDVLGGSLEVGRMPLTLGQGLIAFTPGNFDAAKFNFGGKELKGFVGYGDISPATYYPWNQGMTSGSVPIWPTANAAMTAANVEVANLSYTPNKNLNFTAATLNSSTKAYPYQVSSLGMKAKMGDFTLNAEGARNQKADTDRDAMTVGLMYKGAQNDKVGSFGIGAQYNKFEANSVDGWLTNMDGIMNSVGKMSAPGLFGAKGLEYTVNYAVTKNGILSASVAPSMETVSSGLGKAEISNNYPSIGGNNGQATYYGEPQLAHVGDGVNGTPDVKPGTKYSPFVSVKAEFKF